MGKRPSVTVVFCLLWGAGIVAGLSKVTSYSNTPEATSAQPRHWPKGTQVRLAAQGPTLLMTLHPRCTCSRATLEELARLLAQTRMRPRVKVLLYEPAVQAGSWEQSDLARKARSIPGVEVRPDVKGVESERFGMSISGQTALYAADGTLLFSGGITSARGHVGDNAGRSSIVSILLNQQPITSHTPVYGCSIRDRS